MIKETLHVTGMSCGHCSARVESVLKELDGVNSAAVDLESGTAVVEYDEDKVEPDSMRKAIEDAGYGVGDGASAVDSEKPKKRGLFRRG